MSSQLPPPAYNIAAFGPMHGNRPELPMAHRNFFLDEPAATYDDPDALIVKFQTIVRDGREIVVGRLKIGTGRPPPDEHAFILRRYDTGAISVTTMFKAAFPGASDEEEEREMRWIKSMFDMTNMNGGRDSAIVKLAGTWIPPATATSLAGAYRLAEWIEAITNAQPVEGVAYRKSQRSQAAADAAAAKRNQENAGQMSATNGNVNGGTSTTTAAAPAAASIPTSDPPSYQAHAPVNGGQTPAAARNGAPTSTTVVDSNRTLGARRSGTTPDLGANSTPSSNVNGNVDPNGEVTPRATATGAGAGAAASSRPPAAKRARVEEREETRGRSVRPGGRAPATTSTSAAQMQVDPTGEDGSDYARNQEEVQDQGEGGFGNDDVNMDDAPQAEAEGQGETVIVTLEEQVEIHSPVGVNIDQAAQEQILQSQADVRRLREEVEARARAGVTPEEMGVVVTQGNSSGARARARGVKRSVEESEEVEGDGAGAVVGGGMERRLIRRGGVREVNIVEPREAVRQQGLVASMAFAFGVATAGFVFNYFG